MIKYVIGHWTGGMLSPNGTDKNSYQLLIDGRGKVHSGKPPGCTSSTGGMNSITYNIACCGGLSISKITPVQIEKFYKTCAEKLKEYGLTPEEFYTHARIGEMVRDGSIVKLLPKNRYLSQNVGKIDLTEIPNCKGNASQSCSYIRNKIKWYYEKIR